MPPGSEDDDKLASATAGGLSSTKDEVIVESQSTEIISRSTLHIFQMNTAHMTPEAAGAARDVARYTHAVPAEEKTKRAKQRTYRHYVTVAGALALGGAACHFLTGGVLATVLIALAGFVTVDSVVGKVTEKKEDK